MQQLEKIDVTVLEPRLKHPTVFQAFDGLEGGQAFVLHNDHDPKPLYYQLLGERGNIFSWSYLQSGPQIWEVEIRKHEAGKVPETLGEIAAKDLAKAEIFKKYGLDFCCGGKKTLEDACREKGLDVVRIREELSKPQIQHDDYVAVLDYNNWSSTFLADYIENVHHVYVRNNVSGLRELAKSVTTHHGAAHPELNMIYEKVQEIINELVIHMKKEEQVLFPYIRQIEAAKGQGGDTGACFPSVKSPISVMEQDHEVVATLFRDIESLTGNYSLPADSCNSYALFFKKLKAFYADLVLHIHLENNILFPKAIAM